MEKKFKIKQRSRFLLPTSEFDRLQQNQAILSKDDITSDESESSLFSTKSMSNSTNIPQTEKQRQEQNLAILQKDDIVIDDFQTNAETMTNSNHTQQQQQQQKMGDEDSDDPDYMLFSKPKGFVAKGTNQIERFKTSYSLFHTNQQQQQDSEPKPPRSYNPLEVYLETTSSTTTKQLKKLPQPTNFSSKETVLHKQDLKKESDLFQKKRKIEQIMLEDDDDDIVQSLTSSSTTKLLVNNISSKTSSTSTTIRNQSSKNKKMTQQISKNKKQKITTTEKTKTKEPKEFGRYDEKSVTKSDGRHLLQLQWPEAFYPRPPQIPKTGNVHQDAYLVLADEIQTIKSFIPDPTSDAYKPIMFEEFMAGLLRSAIYTLESQPSTKIYGFVLDKSKYVPISKGVEQTKRSAKIASDPEKHEEKYSVPPADGIDFRHRRPYLVPGKELPTDWNLAKHDRHGTLQDIIKCISKSMCDVRTTPSNVPNIPPTKRMFVDGHALNLDDVMSLASIYPDREMAIMHKEKRYNPELLGLKATWQMSGFCDSETDVYDTPICFEYYIDKETFEDGRLIYFLKPLRNRIGEADFAFFTLHRLVSQMEYMNDLKETGEIVKCCLSEKAKRDFEFLPLDIYSIDTDIIYLASIFADKIRKTFLKLIPPIWMRFAPKMSWGFGRYFGLKDEFCHWCCINELYKSIEIDAEFKPPPTSNNAADDDEDNENEDDENNAAKSKKKGSKFTKLVSDPNLLKNYSFNLRYFVEDRILSLIITLLIGGGDYTSGPRSITTEKLFLSFKMFSKTIGNLVEKHDEHENELEESLLENFNSGVEKENMSLSPSDISNQKSSFQNQNLSADSAAGKKARAEEELAKFRNQYENELNPKQKYGFPYYTVSGNAFSKVIRGGYILARKMKNDNGDDADPAEVSWHKLQNNFSRLAAQNQPLTVHQMIPRRLHLTHYLFMISQLGDRCLLEPLDLHFYCFEKYREDDPWDGRNILRITNTACEKK